MAMGSLSDEDDFNSEINTTLLVDVMLVLLIIFIITIPVMNHAVKLDLPRDASQPNEVKPETISLSIDSDLASRIADAAKVTPQPELHLHAARTSQYEKVAQVMSAAQAGGLRKVGFITETAEISLRFSFHKKRCKTAIRLAFNNRNKNDSLSQKVGKTTKNRSSSTIM